MRLKYVFIKEYKNLKEFEITFDGSSFIDVFVGKNGSGKSNFFEALIKIFHHLHKDAEILFDYIIKYEMNGQEIEIKWENNQRYVGGRPQVTLGQAPFPNNIIVYYSGHNKQISHLLEQYESSFGKRIKNSTIDDSRFFIGIGPEYKEILLSVLLLQNESNKAREFLMNQLGIYRLGMQKPGQSDLTEPILKLVLKRPKYAKTDSYNIEHNDESDRYWKADGLVKDFINRLSSCSVDSFGNMPVDQGYMHSSEQYIFYCAIEKIQNEFSSYTLKQLFNQFDNLKTLGMLESMSIPLELNNGLSGNILDFSDGQFQSIYIYTIMEIFKDLECVTLLDEPDAFLHPEWQFKFLEQVYEITNTTSKNNHVLMSSHSAITLVNYDNRKIRMFVFDNSKIKTMEVHKKYAIDQLSSNLIQYGENEQILSILRNIQIEKMPILFTEGSTDPDILRIAWNKLYAEPMPFIPFYALNCTYIRPLIQDERIQNEIEGKAIFGLYDFDEAYNEWKSLKEKETWSDFENDPYKGLCIGNESKKQYAFVIPVPSIDEIEKQVILDKVQKTHFGYKSKMEIEHLFYGDNTKNYFETIPQAGGGQTIEFKTNKKNKFAKEVVNSIDSSYFEVFRPMLDFIKSKC
ncbi:AAA family ATPase [Aliarcobacter butzleri]|uniref:AAA family ATPase n=1 Tax=Aliarcobacter butzleri TaxID=28197 RepID=UPI003AF961D1